MESGAAVETADEVTAELAAMLARFTALATAPDAGDDAADAHRIDRIALLEQIKSAAAAAQHTQMVRFARSQVESHIADDTLDPTAVGRGIADQIALACRVSPFAGSRRLGTARALHAELPGIRALLARGRISEDTAALVTAETSHLDPERRRQVDAQLCAAGVEQLSSRRAAALARRYAYAADPAGYVARGRTARADRRVTLRPAPDTMSLLSGFLPVEQGVACLAALRRHTDALVATGDIRGRGQIMADTLVERLTGQARAADVNVEVGIVMSLDALVGAADGAAGGAADAGTAEVVGQGPIPAGIAHNLLQATEGRRWWRRLFTAPEGGPLVGGDPRRRAFDGVLAGLVGVRDGGRCRDPYCDAPIRHVDHIRRTGRAARRASRTAAGYAPAATTCERCPAGGWRWSTTGWADIHTRCARPPRPATPIPAPPDPLPNATSPVDTGALASQPVLTPSGYVDARTSHPADESRRACHPGGLAHQDPNPNGHDGGFDLTADATFDSARKTWEDEIARGRANCATRTLDQTRRLMGGSVTLRWIYNHMIAEYARHAGHADLIRERIDGATGV